MTIFCWRKFFWHIIIWCGRMDTSSPIQCWVYDWDGPADREEKLCVTGWWWTLGLNQGTSTVFCYNYNFTKKNHHRHNWGRKGVLYIRLFNGIARTVQLVHTNRNYNHNPTPTGFVLRIHRHLPGLSRLLVSPSRDDVTPVLLLFSVLPSKYGGGFVGAYGGVYGGA